MSKETIYGPSKIKRRKYDHNNLKQGFSCDGSEDASLPQSCTRLQVVLFEDNSSFLFHIFHALTQLEPFANKMCHFDHVSVPLFRPLC